MRETTSKSALTFFLSRARTSPSRTITELNRVGDLSFVRSGLKNRDMYMVSPPHTK